MASDNDMVLNVISVFSNSSKKISHTVKSKQYNTMSEKHEYEVSDQFKDFRSTLWAKHAELNPQPQNIVQEAPSIVVGDSAIFYARRPRM